MDSVINVVIDLKDEIINPKKNFTKPVFAFSFV